jgi:hypothetical protein
VSAWCRLALTEDEPRGATAAARVTTPHGEPAGWLAVWDRDAEASRHALRADRRLLDAAGEAATVSLVLTPPGVRLPFDDPAVQHVRRHVLARPPFDAVSTLLRDASHFAGAITVARGAQLARLADDPFARLFAPQVLLVEAGLLGTMPPPAGPVIERYGSGQPWPWDRFPDK